MTQHSFEFGGFMEVVPLVIKREIQFPNVAITLMKRWLITYLIHPVRST
jgi:hypothetical protein